MSKSLKDIPQTVKFVQATINRGLELEKADPVISYYCKLHAVQDIIANGVHLSNEEAANYAANLLDNIELVKTTDPVVSSERGMAIISDDLTGQAYVDNFANKVFAKADGEIRHKRTTRATSSTFIAAATFFDLLRLFGDLDTEVIQKIKYCKFHAARIIKAYKAGQDPNDYETEETQDEENTEEKVQGVIADVLKDDRGEGEQSLINDSTFPEPPSIPTLPTAPPVLPTAPESLPGRATNFPKPPSDDVSFPDIPRGFVVASASPQSSSPPPAAAPAAPTQPPPIQPHPQSKPSNGLRLSKDDIRKMMDESEILASAQKHAKFAISALNYEDKATAIKELTKALDLLTAHD